MTMEIKHKSTKEGGSFYIGEDDNISAELIYEMAGSGKLIIKHTEVDDVHKGKGIGKQLVLAVVEYSRERHMKIIPLCPFAASVFDRDKELTDVLF